MRLAHNPQLQLAYCTNIHPTNGLEQVLRDLGHYGAALRTLLAPAAPFGIGLRLSGAESDEALQGQNLERLREALDSQGLYVFTMNGFPYGPFHGQPVKSVVHAPDWRDEERVRYTLRLIEILAALLPEGTDGGISTSPLSYKAWVNLRDDGPWQQMAHNIARVAAAMARVERTTGKLLHLDIEPEPDGLLETSAELVAFFDHWLLRDGAAFLAPMLEVPVAQARELLLRHVRVCFDTCHVAVAYEAPAAVLERLAGSGILVGKVQISSALQAPLPAAPADRAPLVAALTPFVESTYLHQVVQRNHDGTLVGFADLPDALPQIGKAEAAEWRVHFHVPVFLERYGALGSTQATIVETFRLLREQQFTGHLEIETYTWGVLPHDMKLDVLQSIEREYRWVLRCLEE